LTGSTPKSNRCPVLRLAQEVDLEQVLKLEGQIFSDAWPRAAFEEHLDTDDAGLIAAEIDRRIIGYACYRFDDNDLHLTNLAVVAEHRRKSVAKGLLEHILGLARDRASELIFLEARASNEAARGFYEAAGFAVVDLIPGYYENPVEDAIVMSMVIDTARHDD
jgi:ribosomal-protein-alanine N-acetyltransferase